MSSYRPVPKVVATGVGGAAATLAVWLVSAFGGPEVPGEAAAALTALLAFAAGYLRTPAEPEGDGGWSAVELLVVVVLVLAILVLLGFLPR